MKSNYQAPLCIYGTAIIKGSSAFSKPCFFVSSILLRVFHYLFLVLRFKKRGKRIFHSYDEAFGTTDAIKFILFAIKVRYDVFEVSFAPSQTPSLYFWWQ